MYLSHSENPSLELRCARPGILPSTPLTSPLGLRRLFLAAVIGLRQHPESLAYLHNRRLTPGALTANLEHIQGRVGRWDNALSTNSWPMLKAVKARSNILSLRSSPLSLLRLPEPSLMDCSIFFQSHLLPFLQSLGLHPKAERYLLHPSLAIE